MEKKKIDWNKELNGLSEEEQVSWFVKFKEERKINSPGQLYKEYPPLVKYYSKFSEESKKKIFPLKKNNWAKELKGRPEEEQVEWFLAFNKKNGINSLMQLRKEYPSLKIFYQRLSKESREKIFSPKNKDWSSELKGLSEEKQVDWIIKFNKDHGIISLAQLREKYPSLIILYYSKFSQENKERIFEPTRNNWINELEGLSEEEQVEWFIKFKEERGIKLISQFNRKYSRLGKYYYSFSKENRDKIFPPIQYDWHSQLKDLTEEEQINWFIGFNKDHRIISLDQLREKYPGLLSHFFKISQKNKERIFPFIQKRWSSELGGLSEEERLMWFINFKKEKKINSVEQLWKEFPGLTSYYCELSTENRRKIFLPVISRGEKTAGILLTKAGYSFTTQKDFPDLRSDKGGILRYDIYIEQKNCLIEFHGSQHFNPNVGWYDEEAIERDKIKYQYAIDHGIPIFYITNYIADYKKYGYFTEVLTDWDELIENIDSLPDVIVDAEDTAQN